MSPGGVAALLVVGAPSLVATLERPRAHLTRVPALLEILALAEPRADPRRLAAWSPVDPFDPGTLAGLGLDLDRRFSLVAAPAGPVLLATLAEPDRWRRWAAEHGVRDAAGVVFGRGRRRTLASIKGSQLRVTPVPNPLGLPNPEGDRGGPLTAATRARAAARWASLSPPRPPRIPGAPRPAATLQLRERGTIERLDAAFVFAKDRSLEVRGQLAWTPAQDRAFRAVVGSGARDGRLETTGEPVALALSVHLTREGWARILAELGAPPALAGELTSLAQVELLKRGAVRAMVRTRRSAAADGLATWVRTAFPKATVRVEGTRIAIGLGSDAPAREARPDLRSGFRCVVHPSWLLPAARALARRDASLGIPETAITLAAVAYSSLLRIDSDVSFELNRGRRGFNVRGRWAGRQHRAEKPGRAEP